jgi:tRNA G10  N-methylase Trm11
MQYYSTYPVGFSEICKRILIEKEPQVKIEEIGDNYISYSSNFDIYKIKELLFFEQTFLLVRYFKEEDKGFSNQIDWFDRHSSSVNFKLAKLGERTSYRIVGSSNILDNSRIQSEITSIERSVRIDRGNADFDIRIVEKEDHGFIGVRLTKPAEYADYLQKSSLRKEIAYYMLYLSEMKPSDVFLDPFCGGGIIPLLRSQSGSYKDIVASDVKTEGITGKLNQIRSKIKNFQIISSDINEIGSKIDNPVNKIVSDPPWGLIENYEDIEGFYKNMLDQFFNILEANGIIVLLTTQIESVKEYVSNNAGKFEVVEEVRGKISGRESHIIKMVRL